METVELNRARITTVRLPEIIEQAFGCTRSQARRFLKDGAVKIDGEKWEHLTGCVDDVDGKVMQIGKRQFRRIYVALDNSIQVR